jgi:putative methyltransferase (TIGR04325 family)
MKTQTWRIRRAAKLLRLGEVYETIGTLRSPFRGVYDSWEDARSAIPEDRKIGYDHPDAAPMYLDFLDKIRLSDYAALFWLKSAIAESTSVFDLGGNVGLECYAFQKYLHYPGNLRWIVCDVPEVTRLGRKLAQERNMTRLVFTEDVCQADGTDILLTAGTLQCMETDLSVILSQLSRKPRHLIVNRVPLYNGKAFCTVRDLPPVMLVYRVFNRIEFIESVQANGYKLMDAWDIAEPACGTCIIPFHPDKTIRNYSGLYFRAD